MDSNPFSPDALLQYYAQTQQAPNSFASMTPQQRQQVASGGAMEDEYASLEGQLAQARALRNQRSGTHTTAVGGALGALGDIISGIRGSGQESSVLEKEAALRAQQTKMRGTQLDAYGKGYANLQQQLAQAQALRAPLSRPPLPGDNGDVADELSPYPR